VRDAFAKVTQKPLIDSQVREKLEYERIVAGKAKKTE
jgi:hypothetical protein